MGPASTNVLASAQNKPMRVASLNVPRALPLVSTVSNKTTHRLIRHAILIIVMVEHSAQDSGRRLPRAVFAFAEMRDQDKHQG